MIRFAHGLNQELLFHGPHERDFTVTGQIGYNTVVVQYLHHVIGEDDGLEVLIFCIRILYARFLFPLVRHAHGAGAAMMAVRNVKCGHRLKETGDLTDLHRIVYHIQGIAHAVFGDKVDDRFPLRHQLQDVRADFRTLPVGQEHRTGLGFCHGNVTYPVLLLFGPGQFVPADGAVAVFFHRCRCHQSDLDMLVHPLPVNIKAGRLILFHFAAGNIADQIFPGLCVDFITVGVCTFGQRGFRFGYC